MSTIVVVRKGDAVALAADTLWKDGSTMQRATMIVNHSKVVRVDDSLLAFTGSFTWKHVLSRYFGRLKQPADLSSVDAIFETIHRMHPVLKRRYGINPSDGDRDAFELSRFNIMVANPHGAFVIYSDRTVSEAATFYAMGSGYRYALGAMHAAYPLLDCPEAIARAGVEAAAELDEDTGAPIEVHRIELSHGRKPV